MATNAERQASYRKQRTFANSGDGEARLNTWISNQARFALERLSSHYGVTKKEMLERLLIEADETEQRARYDDEAFQEYLLRSNKKLPKRRPV
ncbi:hypothetical protein AB4090_14390 [Acidithiobacillus sp. IBUN Pt1247-S3]|uniref:hypothetical protein n=1 Tax=Acidithiobacillus sp. IBUN Pt1247-S3 TaxID=3166642 RepID=UPI0034E4FB78